MSSSYRYKILDVTPHRECMLCGAGPTLKVTLQSITSKGFLSWNYCYDCLSRDGDLSHKDRKRAEILLAQIGYEL